MTDESTPKPNENVRVKSKGANPADDGFGKGDGYRATSTTAWTTPQSVTYRTGTVRLVSSQSNGMTAGIFLARLASEHISTTKRVKFTAVGPAQVAVIRVKTLTSTRREAGLRNSYPTVS